MKRNTVYLLTGVIASIEIAIFWLSEPAHNPLPALESCIAGIVLVHGLRRYVEEPIGAAKTGLIARKAALRTPEVFRIVFFVISPGSAVIRFRRTPGIAPPHPLFPSTCDLPPIGFFGNLQRGMPALMVLHNVGFRCHDARMYGGFATDEE